MLDQPVRRGRTRLPMGQWRSGAQASQNVSRRLCQGPCGQRDRPRLSDRGAGVARGVRRGLALAGRWYGKACGLGGAGCAIGRLSWHAQSLARRGCEAAGAGGEGRRRRSSAGLGRRAERRTWRRAARPARRAGGVRRGSGPGWRERRRGVLLLSRSDRTRCEANRKVTRWSSFCRRSLRLIFLVAANTEISCTSTKVVS